ncbi:connexin 27.5 [Plakobranchus ocellatus]|uniref:Connexin 27.5 n=1 Tax=Plakobranchus ocellatus TaxID=259542 RepID=A0AAV3YGJ7_9GAST|nr:connexin 27.5 [Plakobranchus ocellatus]
MVSKGKCGPPPAKKSKTCGSGRHKKEWESPDFEKGRYAGLIKPSSEGPTHTFCIPCRKSIKVTASGVYDLHAHFDTQAHKKCVEKSKTYRSMDEHFQPAAAVKPTPSNATEAEVMFCHFVAEHNLAPLVADHFTDLVKKMFPQCTVAKEFACKRTKTTMVIKDTLAPHYTLPVIEAMRNGPFTIMIDESNNKNTEKRLVILARLFNGKMSKTRFLDMPIPASGKALGPICRN